jgi:hypothetical protein
MTMMNLEAIEQKCLSYLKQVKNPLVPISTLLRHLDQDEACRGVREQELIDFLRKHELFRVIDAPEAHKEPGTAEELASQGIDTAPRVILVTRIPTQPEMKAVISAELKKMTSALARAQAEAAESGDGEAYNRITEILERVDTLEKGIDESFQSFND